MAGLPSWARVGAEVVCIMDFGVYLPEYPVGTIVPAEGQTYVIRETVGDGLNFGLRLKEIVNGAGRYVDPYGRPLPGEPAFILKGFAPKVAQKTEAEDMAVFKPLLHTRLTELADQLDQQWVGMPDLNHVPDVEPSASLMKRLQHLRNVYLSRRYRRRGV